MNDSASGPRGPLTEAHADYLAGHAITLEVALAAGVRSVFLHSDLPPLLEHHYRSRGAMVVPGIVFGWYSADGAEPVWELRPDHPPEGCPKYLWSLADLVINVLPCMRERAADPAVPLVYVEGNKQVLAAVSAVGDLPYAVAGLHGCWGWSRDKLPSPELALIPHAGRDVVFCFDGDRTSNRGVWDAAQGLAAAVRALGAASVRYLELPARGENGIDDYLSTVPESDRGAVLARLITSAPAKPGRRPPPWKGEPGQAGGAEPEPGEGPDAVPMTAPSSGGPDAAPAPQAPPPLAWSPDIPGAAVAHLRQCRGLIGEDRTARLAYLAFLTSVLDDPVNVAMKGLSSSGKSYAIESVASLLPDEAVFTMTGMSDRALAYLDEPLTHRTIVLYEAIALREDREKGESSLAAYFMRSLLSEGEIRYAVVVKDPATERFVTMVRHIPGPTNLVTSTTSVSLHAENETRMLSLPSDDSRAQTRAVLIGAAEERKRGECDHREWHDLRRWIAQQDTRVLIPYATCVAARIDPAAVRLRRDWNAVRSLIKAHALLHQVHRPRDAWGRVVATLDDYAAVRGLTDDLIAEAIGASVPGSVRQTVDAVAWLAQTGTPATVRQVADRLKIERSAASRRLATAAQHGYVINAEDKRGRPARYERTTVTLAGTCAVLPEPAQFCTPHCTPHCASLTSGNAGGCAGVQRARRG
jgi:hypothetical protein